MKIPQEKCLACVTLMAVCIIIPEFFSITLSLQKFKMRKAAFAKTTAITEEEKKNWAAIMKLEMMSSEESGCDSGSDHEDGVTSMFIKHPLPWRSNKITALFKSLDGKARKRQSRRGQQMMQQRTVGSPSARTRPTGVPEWAFTK